MNRMLTAAIVVVTLGAAAEAASSPESVVVVTERGRLSLTLRCELPPAMALAAAPDFGGESVVIDGKTLAVPAVTRWIAVPEGAAPELNVTARRSNQSGKVGKWESGKVLGLWPPQPAVVGPVKILRGVPIAPLTIYPLQLDQNGDGAIENRDLELSIRFVPQSSAATPRPFHEAAGSRTARFVDRLLLNPPQRDLGEDQEEHFDRILILHQADLREQDGVAWVDSLANWKRQMGYKVDIVPVDLERLGPVEILQMIRADYYFVDDPISHLIIIGADTANQAVSFPTFTAGQGRRGDHFYGLMDDNDQFTTDITVGRFEVWSYAELQATIKRSILYERSPYRDQGDAWFTHALYTAENIAAPGGQFVPSMVQLGRWIYSRWAQMGYDDVDTLYTGSNAEQQRQVNSEVRRILEEEGVSVAISRGWLAGCIIDRDRNIVVNTSRRNPFVMAITCLSKDTQVSFFKTTETNNPRGPIASMACFGLTRTRTNNGLMGGLMRAMRYFDLSQPGFIQNFSKLQLWSDYYAYDADVRAEMLDLLSIFRLMGDPTVDVFTDVPTPLEAAHPATIVPGTTGLNVRVTVGGAPRDDAKVCVWQEGGIHLVATPGDDGVARFVFPVGELEGGTIKLTVTDHNCIPYIATIPIQAANPAIDLSNLVLEGQDGEYRAGETVRATLTLHNSGQAAANEVVVAFSSESSWVRFIPDTVRINSIGANGSQNAVVQLPIRRSAPAAARVRVNAHVSAGNNVWEPAFELTVTAPDLYVATVDFIGDDQFGRGRTTRLQPVLRNAGGAPSADVTARLVSLDTARIHVLEAEAQFAAADADGGNAAINGQFVVAVDSTAIPGNDALFILILRNDQGDEAFVDTVEFALPIGRRDDTDPVGPDAYGYLCFDSYDDGWSKRPTYGWREINPRREDHEFEGERVDIRDYRVDLDSSVVLPLPFVFRYYGRDFDTVVVCSNGWIAFGAENSMFIDFRNWTIPGVQGPDAQLAVFWDDLINPVWFNRGIFAYSDTAEGIFIIEWSEMQLNADADNNLQEFQLILFDPARWPTSTGDGEIKFQYKHVAEAPGDGTDNSFATVGIKNLDGSDGLLISYWNHPMAGARRLEDGLALLFTTDVELLVGGVAGRVVTAEDTARNVEGVVVTVPGAGSATTNAQGRYAIERVPVGHYTVSFAKAGYNVARVQAQVEQGHITTADARLTHPLLDVQDGGIEASLRPGDNHGDVNLVVGNRGNGELNFRLSRRYEDGRAPDYVQLLGVSIRELDQQNNYQGCEIVGDTIFVTSSGLAGDPNDNWILAIDRRGQEIRRFVQPSISGVGLRDLAWDGRYLYGGEDSLVFKFDTYGNVAARIRVPIWGERGDSLLHPAALAWNPEHQTLMMAHRASDIVEMNLEGRIVSRFHVILPRIVSDITGLAWNPADDDGLPLYALMRTSPDGRRMWLIKASPQRVVAVRQLAVNGTELGAGLAISYDWLRYRGVLATVAVDAPRDTLRVFEIGPDCRGLSFDRDWQAVPADRSLAFPLHFASAGLAAGTYQYGLVVLHNAASDSVVVPVRFWVDRNAAVNDAPATPLEFRLDGAYPNPFNSTTELRFRLPVAGLTRLTIYDVAGREVARLVEGELPAGRHRALWEADVIGSGLYFARLEAAGMSNVVRLLLIR